MRTLSLALLTTCLACATSTHEAHPSAVVDNDAPVQPAAPLPSEPVVVAPTAPELPAPAATTEPVVPDKVSTTPLAQRSQAPREIYGSWHEDQRTEHPEGRVMVPTSVSLGPSSYRMALEFGSDGSFSTSRLHPADAHYTCKGSFVASSKTELVATCFDKLAQADISLTIRLVDVREARLVVHVTEPK
jgi:hypothetical protein